jgi:hypothetical protein
MVKSDRKKIENRLSKRRSSSKQSLPSKRRVCHSLAIDERTSGSICNTDTESQDSISDHVDIQEQCDDTSDVDNSNEHATLSTDQQPYRSVVYPSDMSRRTLTSHAYRHRKQFSSLYNESSRTSIRLIRGTTDAIETNNKVHCQMRNSFHRPDLIQHGYAVLSDQSFPFHSLCYMVSICRRTRYLDLQLTWLF